MRWVVVVLAVLVVAGCGGQAPPAGLSVEPEPLWGKRFLLDTANVDGSAKTLVADTEVFLEFTDDRRLLAGAGCNTMSGQVTLDGGTLTTPELATTDMGCDPARHEQDAWLGEFLAAEPAWELTGEKLVLRGEGTELVLTDREVADPDRPLAGTPWTVDTLVDGQSASSTPAGAPPATVEFGADQVVEVFTGCNSGSAAYTVEGDTITVDPLVLTRMACVGETMRVEQAVVAVLDGPVAFEVEADALTLTHPSGEGLRLRAE